MVTSICWNSGQFDPSVLKGVVHVSEAVQRFSWQPRGPPQWCHMTFGLCGSASVVAERARETRCSSCSSTSTAHPTQGKNFHSEGRELEQAWTCGQRKKLRTMSNIDIECNKH